MVLELRMDSMQGKSYGNLWRLVFLAIPFLPGLVQMGSTAGGCASLQDVTSGDIPDSGSGQENALDKPTVVAGIKEALHIGTDRPVISTSQLDGFLANELIRIDTPQQLEPMASTLRRAGLGNQVDELETGMNRAAELAAGEARQVFWDAINQMTIADAFAILKGNDTAVTTYFRDRTWQSLQKRFQPIVQQKMEEMGLSRIYGESTDLYEELPLADKPTLVDLDDYITGETISGLFIVLAQEEQKIRQDPVARTTELLRRVFG